MADDPLAWRFPSTRWSRVVAARERDTPEARAALEALCSAYWYPVYAFIRRTGHDADSALDLTQDFFARLLERGILAAADPNRGRFRSLLLADCRRLLADRLAHDRAAKRGGGRALLSIDARDAEGRYLHEPAHGRTPDRLFERTWALTLLDGVLARLRAESEQNGRGATFEVLKVALTEDARCVPYAELARRLDTTAGAVQVAVHRLRRRYRALVREEIASTVAEPALVDDEIRDLFAALAD
jgi:RNA polymerase sigma-70 factor (ECF subfamily)